MSGHPIFARVYERISAMAEAAGNADHRQELLAGLTGVVCEVGAGNGLNFGHYPSAVARVIAVEPEPHLRRLAERSAASAAVPVTVLPGAAEALPVDADSVDVVVMSLVLCSVTDVGRALAEARRVLRPEGRLRFYEHVISQEPKMAARQRLADKLIWPTVAGGCHSARNTLVAITDAAFLIQEPVTRFLFAPAGWMPTAPHVIGTATVAKGSAIPDAGGPAATRRSRSLVTVLRRHRRRKGPR